MRLIAAEALRVRAWGGDATPDAYGIADLVGGIGQDGTLIRNYTGAEPYQLPPGQLATTSLKDGETITVNVEGGDGEVVLNNQCYKIGPGFTIVNDNDVITVRDKNGNLVKPHSPARQPIID